MLASMLASLAEKKLVRKVKKRGFEVLLNNNFLVDI